MPDAVRSVLAAALPAAVLAVLWGRMEDPTAAGALLGVAALGIVPAAVRRPRARAAVAAAVVLGGLSVVYSTSPVAALPGTSGTWIGSVIADAKDGFRGFERLAPPFPPTERPTMHALVLTAVLGFSVAVALAVAARKPLLAGAVVVVGGGWATASVAGRELVLGAVLLLATLWPLLVMRIRTTREGVVGAAVLGVVIALGVGVAGAGAAPREPYLDWKSWSLLGLAGDRVGVSYVWDAQYEGIRLPERPTTVLRIRAEATARYWRVSTLELFTKDRWYENHYTIGARALGVLPRDPLLPRRATDPGSWVEQEVEVVRLDDARLVAAGQPMQVESSSLEGVIVQSGGVVRALLGEIAPGDRYTIRSYAPRPLPRDLLRSRGVPRQDLDQSLTVDRSVLPPFGAPGRDAAVERLFVDDYHFAMRAYRPLWNAAKAVAGDADSPYEATLAIERWLRADGGFRYEEQPPQGRSAPLAAFVASHRSGYCQHFAGAMALMLRMLGVPARVAVGFTSGRWKDGVWDVADRDAHAWVEAWFAGFGWVTFDPTPGRGTLTAGYTFASDSADAIRALGTGALLDVVDFEGSTGTAARATPAVPPDASAPRRGPVVALMLLGLAGALGVVVVLKELRRRLRYLSPDPRRRALAARLELEEVLRDQGVELRGRGLVELREATERGIGVPAGAFVEALGRARFGPAEGAVQAAADARRELRRVRDTMRERLRPGRRLRGALSVRSLVGRRRPQPAPPRRSATISR